MHSIYRLAHIQKAAKAVRIITKEQGSIEWITLQENSSITLLSHFKQLVGSDLGKVPIDFLPYHRC